MIVGRLPFDGFDEEEMFLRIAQQEPKYPKVIPPDAANCIKLVCEFFLKLHTTLTWDAVKRNV